MSRPGSNPSADPSRAGAFHCLRRVRPNGLWSLWYCGVVLVLHVYLTAGSIQQFVAYIALPWPDEARPFPELDAFVFFVGAAVVLLPFFAVSALLRVGNLANDGCKLGTNPIVPRAGDGGGGSSGRVVVAVVRTVWRHGGPTAPFLHVVSAFCLLFPKVLVQAKLIKYGFLPKDDIWRTDLDFMIAHKDRIMVLGFLAATNRSDHVWTSPSASTERSHSSVSPEFVNYAVALLVYSIRYPAVFWETNKSFSFLFSLQLVLGSVQSLLASAAFAVLYKVNTFGLAALVPHGNRGGFLLGRPASCALFLSSCVAVALSGGAVYLYGLRRFRASLVRQREKHHISWRESSRTLWGYLPHFLAFAILLAILLLACPLMYDLTVVYRGSLDGAVLSGVVGTISYLFAYLVLWFVLTIKQRWRFRLCPSTAPCHGRVDPDHLTPLRRRNSAGSPLVVVSGGHTFTVKDAAPKRAILGVVQRSIIHRHHQKHRCHGIGNKKVEDDEDIYWLKPKNMLDAQGDGEGAYRSATKKRGSSPGINHRVTFEDALDFSGRGGGSSSCKFGSRGAGVGVNGNGRLPKSCLGGKLKKPSVTFEDLTDSEDDGDYATLRDIPLPEVEEEDEEEEEEEVETGEDALERLLKTIEPSDDEERDCDELGRASYDELLSTGSNLSSDPEFLRLLSNRPTHCLNVAVTVHDGSPSPKLGRPNLDILSVQIGADNEEAGHHPPGAITPRSVSSSSSNSPPEKGESSDTSSGVHSSSSICCDRRSSSMDDLAGISTADAHSGEGVGWKSMSLQRTSPVVPNSRVTAILPTTVDPTHSRAGAVWHSQPKQAHPFSTECPAEYGKEFGRATNVRLTSFTDGAVVGVPRGRATTSLGMQPLGGRPITNMSPLAIGILSGSPKHYHHHHISGCAKAPHSTEGVFDRKRDSANYSLASSGESDGNLSHA